MIYSRTDARNRLALATGPKAIQEHLILAMYIAIYEPDEALAELQQHNIYLEKFGHQQSQTAGQCLQAFKLYIEAICLERLGRSKRTAAMLQQAEHLLDTCTDTLFAVNIRSYIITMLDQQARPSEMLRLAAQNVAVFDSVNIQHTPSELFETYSTMLAVSERDIIMSMRAHEEFHLARAYRILGRFDLAFRYYYRSMNSYDRIDSIGAHNFGIRTRIDAIHICFRLGLQQVLKPLWQDVSNMVRKTKARSILKFYHTTEFILQAPELDRSEFEARFNPLITKARTENQITLIATLLKTQAQHLARHGQMQAAANTITQALAVCKPPRNQFTKAILLFTAGEICLKMQDSESALNYAEDLISLATQLDNKHFQLQALVLQTQAHLHGPNPKRALETIAEQQSLQNEVLGPSVLMRIYAAEQEYRQGPLRDKIQQLQDQNELLMRELRRQALNSQDSEPVKHPITSRSNGYNGAQESSSRNIFNQIRARYPGFHDRLRSLYTTLSDSEVKVCTLCRENLSVKEMAEVLSISENAVLKSRWRIRKKLDLRRQQKLNEFLRSI